MLSILVPSNVEPNVVKTLMAIEDQFPGAEVIIATDRYRRGKGWAIREALEQATQRFICFIDGDMEIHPRMIWRLLPFLDDYDIVVGTKRNKGLLSRRILTFLSRIYIKLLFNLDVETQTGIKIFKRDALEPWKTDSFAFDIEVLANAKRRGFSMIEVPIEAEVSRRAKLKSVWNCLIDSLKVWGRIRRLIDKEPALPDM